MAFDWSNFIDLASELLQQAAGAGNPEAYLRSAVSRAYDGAFGYANGYATRFLQYQPRDDADEHGRLRAYMRRKKRAHVADYLGDLRSCRIDADYLDELPWPDVRATVENAIHLAKLVLAALPPPQPRKP